MPHRLMTGPCVNKMKSCQVGHEAGAGADLVRAEQLSDLTTRLFCFVDRQLHHVTAL